MYSSVPTHHQLNHTSNKPHTAMPHTKKGCLQVLTRNRVNCHCAFDLKSELDRLAEINLNTTKSRAWQPTIVGLSMIDIKLRYAMLMESPTPQPIQPLMFCRLKSWAIFQHCTPQRHKDPWILKVSSQNVPVHVALHVARLVDGWEAPSSPERLPIE